MKSVPQGETGILKANGIPILLDLAFASNVRYLDESEMYVMMMMMMVLMMMIRLMSRYMNCVELYTTLPYASGVAMARGVLDSLMSATYFNASALRSYKHDQNLNSNEISKKRGVKYVVYELFYCVCVLYFNLTVVIVVRLLSVSQFKC